MPEWKWSLHDTATGAFLTWVQPVSSTWSRKVNEIASGNQTVFRFDAAEMEGIDLEPLLVPWSTTLVQSLDDVPVYAGVITSPIEDDYGSRTTTVSHADIRALLAKRTTFGYNGYSGASQGHNGIFMKNFAPAAAAAGLVYIAMLNRSGVAALPITLPFSFPAGWPSAPAGTPVDDDAKLVPAPVPSGGGGTYTVSYYDYNLELIDNALTDIQNLSGGPWIEFEPYWVSSDRHLGYRMRAGDLVDAAQVYVWHPDADSPDLQGVTRSRDSQRQATNVYAVGEGSEVKMLVATSALGDDSLPLMETVVSYKTEHRLANLQKLADGTRALYQQPVETWTASLFVDTDAVTELGGLQRFRLGSVHTLYLDNPRFTGSVTLRLIGMSGDAGNKVTLTFSNLNAG